MYTRTTVNRPLLLNTLAEIEAHPERWSQDSWATIFPGKKYRPDNICGTSFCFAGHAAASAGLVPLVYPDSWEDAYDNGDEAYADYFVPYEVAKAARKAYKRDGNLSAVREEIGATQVNIEKWARSELGLTYSQAGRLFNGDNTIEELRSIVLELVSVDDDEQAERLRECGVIY